ncbi:MAG TPA: acyltransferase [Chloroflexota bacterium]|nr:acyltransferase [Chloroflexota bacterium]
MSLRAGAGLARTFPGFLLYRAVVHLRRAWVDFQNRQQIQAGYLVETVLVDRQPGCRISIGQGSTVGAYTLLAAGTYTGPGEAPRPSSLTIGRRTNIAEFNNIRAGSGDIEIGDNCLISQFVSIIAANHGTKRTDIPMRDQAMDQRRRGVRIGNDVWVGANAVILPGTQLGDGAIVMAGAVVSGLVEPYSIVGGSPARVVGSRLRPSVAELEARLLGERSGQ